MLFRSELLFDRKQLQMVWKLRRVLSGLAADGNAAPGLELLIDRLKTFKNNDAFLDQAMPRLWSLGTVLGRQFEAKRPDLVKRFVEASIMAPVLLR